MVSTATLSSSDYTSDCDCDCAWVPTSDSSALLYLRQLWSPTATLSSSDYTGDCDCVWVPTSDCDSLQQQLCPALITPATACGVPTSDCDSLQQQLCPALITPATATACGCPQATALPCSTCDSDGGNGDVDGPPASATGDAAMSGSAHDKCGIPHAEGEKRKAQPETGAVEKRQFTSWGLCGDGLSAKPPLRVLEMEEVAQVCDYGHRMHVTAEPEEGGGVQL